MNTTNLIISLVFMSGIKYHIFTVSGGMCIFLSRSQAIAEGRLLECIFLFLFLLLLLLLLFLLSASLARVSLSLFTLFRIRLVSPAAVAILVGLWETTQKVRLHCLSDVSLLCLCYDSDVTLTGL